MKKFEIFARINGISYFLVSTKTFDEAEKILARLRSRKDLKKVEKFFVK